MGYRVFGKPEIRVWLIWSYPRRAWRRHFLDLYTKKVDDAARFTRAEADWIYSNDPDVEIRHAWCPYFGWLFLGYPAVMFVMEIVPPPRGGWLASTSRRVIDGNSKRH